jgi:hypothetical protein
MVFFFPSVIHPAFHRFPFLEFLYVVSREEKIQEAARATRATITEHQDIGYDQPNWRGC